jgi:hydrogenase maturation protease
MRNDDEFLVPPVLVLGIGNSLLSDDGVGLELLARLRRGHAGDPRVEFVDGGTQGLLLVDRLEGRRALLLLDAVRRGDAPGQVHLERHAERVSTPRGLGAHGGNATELLDAARLLGTLPPRVDLVGIEPASLVTGLGLSRPVRRAVPAAVALARLELAGRFAELAAEGAAACTS